jgi:hypothetical protein
LYASLLRAMSSQNRRVPVVMVDSIAQQVLRAFQHEAGIPDADAALELLNVLAPLSASTVFVLGDIASLLSPIVSCSGSREASWRSNLEVRCCRDLHGDSH